MPAPKYQVMEESLVITGGVLEVGLWIAGRPLTSQYYRCGVSALYGHPKTNLSKPIGEALSYQRELLDAGKPSALEPIEV